MELRMSGKERDRLKVMAALAQRRMRQKEASRLLRLSERQARRGRRGLTNNGIPPQCGGLAGGAVAPTIHTLRLRRQSVAPVP